MARHKGADWNIPDPVKSWEHVQTAILMDIRDELQRLNRTLDCPRFQALPNTLKRIAANTAKPRKRKA